MAHKLCSASLLTNPQKHTCNTQQHKYTHSCARTPSGSAAYPTDTTTQRKSELSCIQAGAPVEEIGRQCPSLHPILSASCRNALQLAGVPPHDPCQGLPSRPSANDCPADCDVLTFRGAIPRGNPRKEHWALHSTLLRLCRPQLNKVCCAWHALALHPNTLIQLFAGHLAGHEGGHICSLAVIQGRHGSLGGDEAGGARGMGGEGEEGKGGNRGSEPSTQTGPAESLTPDLQQGHRKGSVAVGGGVARRQWQGIPCRQ